MEMWLRFVGVTEVSSIVVEKTLFDAALDGESRGQAKEEAVALAAGF
jgi:FMN-dependent NADH-azoreductase